MCRTHGLQVFGDMVDTFSLIMIVQIDNHYELSDKVEFKEASAFRPIAQCDGIAGQCLGRVGLHPTPT
jgi:hypothetical protein